VSESTVSQKSDPRELLRAMIDRGAGNSAEAIMLRLLWMRQDHPAAVVVTDGLHIASDRVVIRASISLPNGAAGSGIAAASMEDGEDWAEKVERTETIAISRALDTLGYVLRATATRTPEVAKPAPASPERPVATPSPTPVESPASRNAPPAVPPVTRPSTRIDESAPSVVNALRRANRSPSSVPPAPAGPPVANEEDAHLEEYSWNSFWARARELGLTPDKVTEILGQPAPQMTPMEAVAKLTEAGAWSPVNEG